MRTTAAYLSDKWLRVPRGVRLVLCWPLLAAIHVTVFPLADLAVNMVIRVALGIFRHPAVFMAPLLSDIVHMAVILPSIRFLVPSRQHFVVFGFAAIVLLALIEIWQTDRPSLPGEYGATARLVNCLVVLAIVSWYGWHIRKPTVRQ
jgi:hypothetical protein